MPPRQDDRPGPEVEDPTGRDRSRSGQAPTGNDCISNSICKKKKMFCEESLLIRKFPAHVASCATTRCSCCPSPAMPKLTTSPGFSQTGSGFLPMPTPGGVPVAMMSPGSRVM